MHFGRFRIDCERLVLEHDGQILPLAPKSVELLAALVERRGEVVAKRDLLDTLWPDGAVEEANLSQHVYVIRKTLAARDPAARAAIVTVPKRGYRFVSPPAAPAPTPPATAPPTPATPLPLPQPAAGFAARSFLRYALAFAVAVVAVLLRGATDRGSAAPAFAALSAEGAEAARIARYNLDLRTPAGIVRSRRYFARVIAVDPRSPVGYAGLADALAITADYRVGTLPPRIYLQRAARLAQRAVALGPQSAEAHTSLGLVAWYLHDRIGARRELQRALALDAGYAPAHHWLGTMLFDSGDFAGSVRELTIATQLNPISTASNAWLEEGAYFTHRYDTAIEHGTRALELDPARRDTLRELGLAYAAKGDYRAALAAFNRIRKTDHESPSVPYLVAAVYARAGQPELATRILGRERPTRDVDAELPFALLALGRSKAAATAATRVHFDDCRERRLFIADPRLDGVRSDTAFGRVFARPCVDRD
jgi:DNA-binding winged helix-turn-helix (wHTH) protein/Tfp pilus assembly protein PilF